MRQLICRRTCEWLEIGYTYRAVRISYLVRLAEVAHIHIGYCKITTCYCARPDKRGQRCSVSSIILTVVPALVCDVVGTEALHYITSIILTVVPALVCDVHLGLKPYITLLVLY